MKNIPLTFLLLVLLTCCKEKGAKDIQISLDWIVDANIDSTGYFNNSFKIINEGNVSLDNNWTIYFNQFPIPFVFPDNSPIHIERIAGTFFKMHPTSHYTSLNKSDTLIVNWKTGRKYPGISFMPDGAYIVIEENGTELPPQNVKIKNFRNDNEFISISAKGNKLYYPFGDVIYNENAKYINNIAISETDIIPSIKSVKNSTNTTKFVFSKEVNIIYDSLYAQEAKILEQSLEKQLSCNISKHGATTIRLSSANPDIKLQNKEHYLLDISQDEINIAGNNPHAIFNGIQTLLSMLSGKTLPADLSQCLISDYPDFEYRGIMLDVARNFTPKDDLIKLIDLLSMYKMNVLHIHITDDEGWRIQIPGLEELTEIGARRGHTTDEKEFLSPAYGSGWNPNDPASLGNGYYTWQDFIDILNYANQRHIRVIPEVDLPGHARAAIIAMKARYNKYKDSDPEKATEYLLTNPADTSRYVSVQGYNDNVVNVSLPSTYHFAEKVIEELSLMYEDAGLKMEIMHIGGDEVPNGAWTGDPECRKMMENHNMQQARELKDYFVEEVLKYARKKDITIAGWQEIALKPHESIVDKRFANDKILSYCWNTVPNWGGDEVAYKLSNAGFQVILSNVSNFYMDMAYSPNFYEPGHNWGGYVDELSSFNMQPFNIYKSVRRDISGKHVGIIPSPDKEKLQAEAHKQILGLQGQLFSETIRSFDMILYYLFPKMLGLSERAWNAEPQWIQTGLEKDYIESISLHNTKISKRELPKLNNFNVNFRLAEPGLKITDGLLYANSRLPESQIRFTTDGSEPTLNSEEWVKPIACKAEIVKAKVFYLGKESVTVTLLNNDSNTSLSTQGSTLP
jgi:hexosaminidase